MKWNDEPSRRAMDRRMGKERPGWPLDLKTAKPKEPAQ